jgi:hypothetical protein
VNRQSSTKFWEGSPDGRPRILEIYPSHGHGTSGQRDRRVDHLRAVHGSLIDEHDNPGRRLSAYNQSQHAFGQAGRVEAFTLQKAREPLVAALELAGLGQGASHRGHIQVAITEADVEGQVEESGGETSRIFAHGAAQEGKVSLHQRADDIVESRVVFHYH